MASKKATKKPTRQTPKDKVKKFVEGAASGKKGPDAVIDAGWNQTRKAARVTASRLLSNANILEAVEKRKAEALSRAGITTDEIVGSIAEIATASLADVDSNDEFLRKAKANGVDHLIKKVKVIYDKQGNITSREYEMYSRLEALDKLLDVRGAKKQAAANPRDVAKQALIDMRARFPDLSEETARQIISETFSVQESELVS